MVGVEILRYVKAASQQNKHQKEDIFTVTGGHKRFCSTMQSMIHCSAMFKDENEIYCYHGNGTPTRTSELQLELQKSHISGGGAGYWFVLR